MTSSNVTLVSAVSALPKGLTIAQSLRLRKELKGKLATLQSRLSGCVSHKESEKPVYDFSEVLVQRDTVELQLVALEAAVAAANATTLIEFEGSKVPLTFAVHYLQQLKGRLAWIPTLPSREGVEREMESRWDEDKSRSVTTHREVKWVCHLPIKARDEEVERLQQQFSSLNDQVERLNHTTVIVLAPASLQTGL